MSVELAGGVGAAAACDDDGGWCVGRDVDAKTSASQLLSRRGRKRVVHTSPLPAAGEWNNAPAMVSPRGQASF